LLRPVFYEIKRGDWEMEQNKARYTDQATRSARRIKMKDLAQATLAFLGDPGDAKDKSREIFENLEERPEPLVNRCPIVLSHSTSLKMVGEVYNLRGDRVVSIGHAYSGGRGGGPTGVSMGRVHRYGASIRERELDQGRWQMFCPDDGIELNARESTASVTVYEACPRCGIAWCYNSELLIGPAYYEAGAPELELLGRATEPARS